MWETEKRGVATAVVCPGCGLGCDDLEIENREGALRVQDRGCELARAHFSASTDSAGSSARIGTDEVSLEQALDRAATLLLQARSPLIAGLATDVNGMRSALALADTCGATLDHFNGDALFRNIRLMQDNGWFTTTYTEVKNRADLVLLVGRYWLERFPRLPERILLPEESLYSPARQRRFVLLGDLARDELPESLRSTEPRIIPMPLERLPEITGMLRGLLAGRPVNPSLLGTETGILLEELARMLEGSSYSVICWSAGELDFPHAELATQVLAELVKELNEKTRSAALPLGGSLGDMTSNQVCTWQLGYPLRTRLALGQPEHDPLLYRYQALLERGECDLLIWLADLSADCPPPPCDPPMILIGHPGLESRKRPEVFIPTGIPGIDHPGHWYRGDAVCPLPLGKLRDSSLPETRQVLRGLEQRVRRHSDATRA